MRTSTGTSTGVHPGEYRVADSDREQVVERLQAAYAAGRLDHDEFDTRVQLAMTARTVNELGAVMVDLERPTYPVAPYGDTRLAPPTQREKSHAALAQATSIVPIVVLPAIILAKTDSPYVRHHAAGALNLQLTLLLLTMVTFGLAGFLYGLVWIVGVVAGVLALGGSPVRYPFTLKLFGRRGPYPT